MSTENLVPEVPEEFIKVLRDFVNDLRTTFPEYTQFVDKWWKTKEHFNYIDDEEARIKLYEQSEKNSLKLLFDFSKKKLPPRFFDILYQNNEIFNEDSNIDTEFLPKIHFKNLWQCDISDKTKETIWKYLQLMLFSVVGSLDNKEQFGDSAKLFESINKDDFKEKLQETLNEMQNLFDLSGNFCENLEEEINKNDFSNPNEDIGEMLDGKIGKLAREIAEETASNLNMDFDGATDIKDVFNKLVKNPTKLMGLVQTVGDKLNSKLKSGELKESEMIKEAADLMNKMKNMPGMDNIQSMLNKMGMGGLGKVNTGAMEAQLKQRMKLAQTKERIRSKAEAKKVERSNFNLESQNNNVSNPIPDEELVKLFSSGEKQEQTPRGQKKKKK